MNLLPTIRLAQSIMRRKFPSVDKPLRIACVVTAKRARETRDRLPSHVILAEVPHFASRVVYGLFRGLSRYVPGMLRVLQTPFGHCKKNKSYRGQKKKRVLGKDEEFVFFVVHFFIIDFWKPEALLVLRQIVCIWQTLLKFPEIGDGCNFLTNNGDKANLLKKFCFFNLCSTYTVANCSTIYL